MLKANVHNNGIKWQNNIGCEELKVRSRRKNEPKRDIKHGQALALDGLSIYVRRNENSTENKICAMFKEFQFASFFCLVFDKKTIPKRSDESQFSDAMRCLVSPSKNGNVF